MKHSKQILSVTSAAVDALSKTKSTQISEKRKNLQQGSLQTVERQVDAGPRSCDSDLSAENYSGGSKESSSSRSSSFSGTQRVRVPSRLLREIKSPLERSPSPFGSKEIADVSNIGNQWIGTSHQEVSPPVHSFLRVVCFNRADAERNFIKLLLQIAGGEASW